ncbi:hypothetical protein LCGC14_2962550, partial [marine sediment metagenome]
MSRSVCSVLGCGKPVKGRGYCCKHLSRVKRHGSVDLPQREKKLCSVKGCNRPARAKNLCNMHRCRLRTHPSPGEAAPRKGNGGTGTLHKSGYRYFYRP